MKIARVFPIRTNITPTDPDAYVGLPDLFTPKYDEVHISITFTWDKPKGKELWCEWSRFANKVKIGGPAFNDPGREFTGLYTRPGVTITSRGCPNNCSFCFVPKREGKIRELPIVPGNIIQDNNLLACSKSHIDKVFSMLKTQNKIRFTGGLEAARVTDDVVEQIRNVNTYQIWLAYDNPNNEKPLKKAINRLSKYFGDRTIMTYVLIGYKDDTIEKAEVRLRRVYELGSMPFAMLYRDEKNTPHTKEWKQFARIWIKPWIIRSRMNPTPHKGGSK